jgi:hypothetical protein
MNKRANYMQPIFDWYHKEPMRMSYLNRCFAEIAPPRIKTLLQLDKNVAAAAGDVIVDVGGSKGVMLAHLLESRPEARGVVYELPGAAAEATEYFEDRQLSDRASAISGDFFTGKDIPEKAALYILSLILHDWNDELCGKILRNVVDRMADSSTLVIMDHVRCLLLATLLLLKATTRWLTDCSLKKCRQHRQLCTIAPNISLRTLIISCLCSVPALDAKSSIPLLHKSHTWPRSFLHGLARCLDIKKCDIGAGAARGGCCMFRGRHGYSHDGCFAWSGAHKQGVQCSSEKGRP